MSLKKVSQKIRQISLTKITEKVIVRKKEELLDLNTERQLFSQGVDSKGNSLGEYSPFTKELKAAKGQPTDRITLKDEGDFYDGFFLKTKKFTFEIDSKDWKTGMLKARFGDIFGLTEQNTHEYISYIKEDIQEDFKKEIKGAFKILR